MLISRINGAAVYKPAVSVLGFVVVVAVSWLLLYPLLDRYYLYIFEPDAQSTIDLTLAIASGQAFRGQPQPGVYPPYFDAQFFFYTLGVLGAKLAVALGVIDSALLPTAQSVGIFAVRNTNLAFYSLGVGFSFLIFLRLSRDLLLSIILAAFVLFSPQMLNIDFMRVDHVIMGLFAATLLLTLTVGRSEQIQTPLLHGLYGATTVSLFLTKVTSVLYLALPLAVYIKRIRILGITHSGLPWFCIGFALIASFFLVRFIPHEIANPGFTLRLAFAKVDDVAQWATLFSKDPLLFYNVDQFRSYGPIFLPFVAVAAVWMIAGRLSLERSFDDIVLIGSVMVLTIFGMFSFKYPRGLYVLAPLYLALIARALPSLSMKLAAAFHMQHAQPAVAVISTIVLSASLYWPVKEYLRLLDEAEYRTASTFEIRTAPRQWMQSNLPAGARITVLMHSDWANTPLEGLGYAVAYRYLEFPYLDSAKMSQYRPPAIEHVRATTDAIVLNNFHYDFYLYTLTRYGHTELRQEWERFFAELRHRFAVQRFEANHASYGVKWIEIIVIR